MCKVQFGPIVSNMMICNCFSIQILFDYDNRYPNSDILVTINIGCLSICSHTIILVFAVIKLPLLM